MSSPVPELLIQENLCTDLFKTISESVEASSQSDYEVTACATYSDDAIEQLLGRMIQILPPEERHIFGSTDDKNIEEIIEEANELIRTTTPLFSFSDSGDRSLNTTSKAFDKSSECSNKHNPEKIISSMKDKSECDSICSSLESIIVKDNIVTFTSKDNTEPTPVKSPVTVSELEMGKDNNTDQVKEHELYEEISQKLSLEVNELKSQPERNSEADSSNVTEHSNTVDQCIRIRKENLKSISEPCYSVNTSSHQNKISIEKRVENSNKNSTQAILHEPKEAGNKSQSVEQKYVTDVQELKLSHNKEIYGLKEQINKLNDQIYELQNQCQLERSPDLKQKHLEHLENELKSQEQLISGYERENKKLCKEISTLKEVWKQRQNQLVEEKQRLQNDLQGMVSKSTTEALEEQLKDARETIVKLQIELTTYKTKNKELEAVCDRLRSETQHLQVELTNCHCERTVGRRDKYSFLASSNVGQQIQDLKNVIARKDAEIEQLGTKLGVLRGELGLVSPLYNQPVESHSLTVSQLQAALNSERQIAKELAKEKEYLLKENLDLKRQVRELESIVKRRQRSDSCFPVSTSDVQSSSRLIELEKELTTRQESLSALHSQFLNMQKKYEEHTKELEDKLKESREEIQNLKVVQKKEESSLVKSNTKKFKQGAPVVKEETHLLATIRGLRQEAANREKEINKLHKEIEEVRQTNRKLQKEREKHLNSIPNKMTSIREKANLRKMDKLSNAAEARTNLPSPNNNNNINPILYAELQESNLILSTKTKNLQEEVKRLEKDLISMHNKRVHDLKVLQSEHDMEVARLMEERATFLSQSSATELQGQVYTQQMVINHLKNRLKQMEELKNEITLLRAERDHLEENLGAVNKKMCHLQNAQSPESIQYKTLLAKLEMLEKNQEIREQKLNAVRELLCRSTQGQGQCSGSCRDKLLDKNRQICYYRAQMDRILESLLEVRRTK